MNGRLLEPCACGATLADMLVARCPCGAIRHGHGGWHQRNQRRIDSTCDPAPPPWDRRLLGSPWFIAAGLLCFALTFVLTFLVTGGSLADLAHVIIP